LSSNELQLILEAIRAYIKQAEESEDRNESVAYYWQAAREFKRLDSRLTLGHISPTDWS
jgi:hypothetical protein